MLRFTVCFCIGLWFACHTNTAQAQVAAPSTDLGDLNTLFMLTDPATIIEFNSGRYITNQNFAQVFGGEDLQTLSEFLLLAIFIQGELAFNLNDPVEALVFFFTTIDVYNQLQVPLPAPVLPVAPTEDQPRVPGNNNNNQQGPGNLPDDITNNLPPGVEIPPEFNQTIPQPTGGNAAPTGNRGGAGNRGS